MIKTVIDTNVLISAILKDRKPEEIILKIAEDQLFEWLVSEKIFNEYLAVLKRPKLNIPKSKQDAWLAMITRFSILKNISKEIEFPRDIKDTPFLACAIQECADFLITGDQDFDSAKDLMGTKIISVSLFHQMFCEKNI